MYQEHRSSYKGGEPTGAAYPGPPFYTEATAVALYLSVLDSAAGGRGRLGQMVFSPQVFQGQMGSLVGGSRHFNLSMAHHAGSSGVTHLNWTCM